jgi:hypothetical protein
MNLSNNVMLLERKRKRAALNVERIGCGRLGLLRKPYF